MKRFSFLASLLAIFGSQTNALPEPQMTQWAEDIDFYVEQVKTKHIKPFHTLSESDFDQQITTLKADLSTLSEVQIETRLMGITSALGDGHSNYFMMSGPHSHFPFQFKYFGEELRIVATTEDYEHLLGSELVSINEVPTADLFERLKHYLSGVDNQFSEKVSFEFHLTLAKLLRGLGIVADGEKAKFVTKRNNSFSTHHIEPISMALFGQIESPYRTHTPAFTMQDIAMPGIQFDIVNETTAYFRFRRYPDVADVLDNCSALQSKLESSNARNLIIDFRGNGGGNFYTGLAFSSCLLPMEQFDWLKGAVLLTDGHTFSAAMSNVVHFKQLFNATVIGEPTGGDPNHFSESYRFELPNSKRKLSLSIRYYPFLETPTDSIYPDELVIQSWEEFEEGLDVVLMRALEYFKR
ncbi:peptidase S41 [Aliidiomarina shirensis]|uniref:Peptidase S41 n=1 Tax=Aliidiomarina shirensis TaxID=1048642 RepID=A0A432WQ28_9GAMM|nr:S41 family peptidase [Aliidiomarina shirensis]RUO35916.1 peptidase S41 [Aliidiomarina shirensis]